MSSAVPVVADTHAVTNPRPVDQPGSPIKDDIEDKGELSYSDINDSVETLDAKWYEPPDSYESKHRWDPEAKWTPKEETKLRRKLDIRVAAFACLCFAALQLDRGNITNALSDGMLADIGLTTAGYNTGMTIFYVCFLSAELPSQMISKKLGSDVWIPIQMMAWSVVAICQVAIKGKSSFYATRALLGLLEGGFVADTVLYYYTSAELTIRLSWFWVSMTTTTIIGSLLATAILKMRGLHGLAGWRWLFAIEGALTFLIGFWAWWYLPASPTQTKKWWRPNGWFTDREETIIVNKVLRDDHTKSSMHNREGLSLKDVWRSVSDFDMWPLYAIGLIAFIVPTTISAYFTLTLKALDFTTFQTNLLTIPSNVLFILMNLGVSFLSKRLKERLMVTTVQPFWHLTFLIVIVALPDDANRWVKWVVTSLLLGFPYCHPILVSMNSMNAGSVRTRTVASSVYNMFVQASALIASNVYQPSDAPYYHKGNRVLIGISVASIVICWLAKAWYIWRNKQRAKIWDSWTVQQKEEYLATTKDSGNKRLDFRFLH
ncbi:transporter, putative [Cryptococcus deneoformans JEC21]|uniref:Transporter, putative n=1 Tax=Cryptococcus deneoformans (strain JEC21 / ATCC MYA-565) TaxID=214684 RepID=Q5KJE6_CRYD1|nr:transporter, putative [Cryptococcus neoformans var. neoformans JEC21]AAW42552.2 transporter, putative [Cryptococcus neoformans var. neoformans JEC21]